MAMSTWVVHATPESGLERLRGRCQGGHRPHLASTSAEENEQWTETQSHRPSIPTKFKRDDPRPMGIRRRGVAPLGPAPRPLARSGDRSDAGHGRHRPGARVLDVAAGAGEQTLSAARRVGPGGPCPRNRHLARRSCAYALRGVAQRQGLRNVETLELDGEQHETLPAGSLRRGDLAGRPDLLPGPAARPARHAPALEAAGGSP